MNRFPSNPNQLNQLVWISKVSNQHVWISTPAKSAGLDRSIHLLFTCLIRLIAHITAQRGLPWMWFLIVKCYPPRLRDTIII